MASNNSAIAYIAADVGGTNSRLLLVKVLEGKEAKETKGEPVLQEEVIAEKTYPSNSASHLTPIIQRFLAEHGKGVEVKAATLAVAGPVAANTAQITNLHWTLDGAEMAKELKIPTVTIINDFAAVGYGLLGISRNDLVPLNDVESTDHGVKAVLGAGTGLGEAFLTYNGQEYDVWPAEGGHCDFAPRDDVEFGLLKFMQKSNRVPRVSVERVVSGLGIPNIYAYLKEAHPEEVSPKVEEELRTTRDPGRVIGTAATNGTCRLCKRTIDMFVAAYGAEAGNVGLKYLPFGGLYIAGGIARQILPEMQDKHSFWQNLINKGRLQTVLEKVPVYVIINANPGLVGAQVLCRRQLKKQGFALKGVHEHFHLKVPKGEADARILQAVVDEQAVIRVVNCVGSYFDMQEWAKLRSCFADSVLLDYQSLCGQPAEQLAADTIIERWKPVRNLFKSTQHLLGNHIVKLDGKEATCITAVVADHFFPHDQGGGNSWVVRGMYHHTLACAGCSWKVTKMKLVVHSIEGNAKLMEISKAAAAKAAPK